MRKFNLKGIFDIGERLWRLKEKFKVENENHNDEDSSENTKGKTTRFNIN